MVLFEFLEVLEVFGDHPCVEYLCHTPIMPPLKRNGIRGHIEPASPGRDGGPFAITELGWRGLGYQPSAEGGWRRRPWWKRMLGV